jgi:hypothetical protein
MPNSRRLRSKTLVAPGVAAEANRVDRMRRKRDALQRQAAPGEIVAIV